MTPRQIGTRETSIGVIGSGNVFADLGLPDIQTHLAKANVVIEMANVMKNLGLTHGSAARLMGMSRPELIKLLHGRTTAHTVDGMKECLRRLSA